MKLQSNGSCLSLEYFNEEIQVCYNKRLILKHSKENAMVYVGIGQEEVSMYHGNFEIKDYISERIPLRLATVVKEESMIKLTLSHDQDAKVLIMLSLDAKGRFIIESKSLDTSINRYWQRIVADEDEKIYGCGEQPSHFNLRGKNYPLWSSEPGVGRNKSTMTTFLADVSGKAGGDYYTTYYPEPTFVSTKKYYLHADSYAYADFDFRNKHFHELQFWEVPKKIVIESGETYKDITSKLTSLLGRQAMLPDWVFEGLILGVQGGTQRVDEIVHKMMEKDIKLAGMFVQDWQGIRMTSFGKRLFWDWKHSEEVYPNLDVKMKEWKTKGLRFMSYINPYLCNDGELYKEAANKGYFAKNKDGEIYLVDFGEFLCGVIDFTNPAAYQWYKELIQVNLIDFGADGWMADFGEYLPTDIVLFDGSDPMLRHNEWPALWAKCNYDAIKERGKLGEVVFFMRAGATKSQEYSTLMWAGDQSVIWELDDGLASVIPSILSTAMTGCGLNHSDIGGYTSLHNNKRTQELFLRWMEMGIFAPFLRSHEGNRPNENFQVYDGDKSAIEHTAFFTGMYRALAPYTKELVKENHEQGIPVNRPLFMEYEDDKNVYDIQYQFMFGSDVLVAPVYEKGVNVWEVYLPKDEWIHIWTKKEYTGGLIEVDAPIGKPPVFVKKGSKVAEVLLSYCER